MPVRKRLVICGFGDVGVNLANHLGNDRRALRELEVVGISTKRCHASGQEVGGRLTQPALWTELYCPPFAAYTGLDRVRVLHGTVLSLDTARQVVRVRLADSGQPCSGDVDGELAAQPSLRPGTPEWGREHDVPYDALLIASGCRSGFWRTPQLQRREDVVAAVHADHDLVARAPEVAVVGGGVTGVAAAYAIRQRFPTKRVHLFFSRTRVLPGWHPRVRLVLRDRLLACGVELHPSHRARLPAGRAFDDTRLQCDGAPVEWTTGQPAFVGSGAGSGGGGRGEGGGGGGGRGEGAEQPRATRRGPPPFVVIWALGRVTPNSEFVPPELKTHGGFVRVDKFLRVVALHGQQRPPPPPPPPQGKQQHHGADDARAEDSSSVATAEVRAATPLQNVFACGDVAATDPQRTSARNFGWRVARDNILASLRGAPLHPYVPPKHRWGSILGLWEDGGMELFLAQGVAVRTPGCLWRRAWPLIQRFVLGGMRYRVNWALRVRTHAVPVRRGLPDVDLGPLLAVSAVLVLVAVVATAGFAALADRE